jgi:predicted branched-subunit amino acid permease
VATESGIAMRGGFKAVSPILLGVIPFGLIFGASAAASDVDQLAAWASSFVIFAGASQLAIVEVMGSGGAAVTALFTAIIINSRHLMYSADMGRYTTRESLGRRAGIGYLLTDQAYLVSSTRFPNPDTSKGVIPYYFGAALTLWTTWQIVTTAGFFLGSVIPDSWSLEFAIPLTFLALLIIAVRTKPALVAAIAGGIVAVGAIDLPYGLGLMAGAVAGIAAGMISERWLA